MALRFRARHRFRLASSFGAALVLGFAALSYAPSVQAAPIVVTYALSGGTSSGPYGVGNITGGTATVVFANPASLSRASFTGGAGQVSQLSLTGTGGVLFHSWSFSPTQLAAVTGNWTLSPSGALSAPGSHHQFGNYPFSASIYFKVSPAPGGGIFTGSWFTGYSAQTKIWWTGVTGQEVVVPEPVTSSLLGFGLLLALALGFQAQRPSRLGRGDSANGPVQRR